jgi:hypothetical protein
MVELTTPALYNNVCALQAMPFKSWDRGMNRPSTPFVGW